MTGLGCWLLMLLGFAAGRVWAHLHAGGVLDLRTCLQVGHQRPARDDGVCPRCRTRIVMVAP